MAERVAIVGVGQTYHRSRRPDVNQVELMNEAVRAALDDAQLTLKDIDAVVMGNMELFEGNYLVDMWASDGIGSYLKPGMKITTGGTTGATISCAAFTYAASGLFNTVLAVAFEKQDEGDTRAGLISVRDPLWDRFMAIGAVATFARMGRSYMRASGCQEEHAALLRVKADRGACRNPYAHLKLNLTIEDVMNSRMLIWPMRLLYMCPTTVGAAALVVASERKAKKITKKPVWVQDWVTVHQQSARVHRPGEEARVRTIGVGETSHERAAQLIYKRNGITKPIRDIDVAEIYEPSTWGELIWYELYGFCEPGEGWRWAEKGVTDMEGEFPVNPSGGVVATNPIGATAMIRIVEAALQVRGDAGEHQMTRPVRRAFTTAWGGQNWTVATLLSKSI